MSINGTLSTGKNKIQLFVAFSVSLAAFAALFVMPQQQSCAKDDPVLHEIGGRVLDSQRNPINNAQIKLLDEDGDLILSTESSSDGSFSMKHKPCSVCTLQVVPDDKSALASALIESIPGDSSRRFQITLQHGFRVHGNITGNGKGLKGLVVKVVAAGKDPAHVHAGGEARTGRDGSFVMTLTPGPKALSIENRKYVDFASKYDSELRVTDDQELPVIKLPPRQQ